MKENENLIKLPNLKEIIIFKTIFFIIFISLIIRFQNYDAVEKKTIQNNE